MSLNFVEMTANVGAYSSSKTKLIKKIMITTSTTQVSFVYLQIIVSNESWSRCFNITL